MTHDFALIGANLEQCRGGRWFAMLRAADAVSHFAASRVLTTVFAVMAMCAALAVLA